MNGAAAVPENTMIIPKNSTRTTMGRSHHFLVVRRKFQNSTIAVSLARLPQFSQNH